MTTPDPARRVCLYVVRRSTVSVDSVRDHVPFYYHDPYPAPRIGTPEDAIKAGLKSRRSLSQVKLSSRPRGKGRSWLGIPDRTCWQMDIWWQAARLPRNERIAVALHYYGGYNNAEIAARMRICPALSCEWRTDMSGRTYCTAHEGSVAAWKRWGVARIAAHLYPAYYRNRKARMAI